MEKQEFTSLQPKDELKRPIEIPTLTFYPEARLLTDIYDSDDFLKNFLYDGDDLGITFSEDTVKIRIWSPLADGITLLLFRDSSEEEAFMAYEMERDVRGTFMKNLPLSVEGLYYLFEIRHGEQRARTPGPDPKAVGLNGEKGLLLNLRKTDPKGFCEDVSPPLKNPVDALIYEVNIRDFSMDETSGIRKKGKYLGFVERGTKSPEEQKTGISHLKELGITHVQLLPFFDFNCLDEEESLAYNWGYDPLNYNVPEGSYSTNPRDGKQRILELKKMIMALHKNKIGVIMDVVYNHTSSGPESNFHKTVPFYYHRTKDGKFTDASACGNETASERPMVRKYILDSLLHWQKEYHVDGFRFDLMGIHDTQTMVEIERELRKAKPDILLYGEGWTAAESPLPEEKRLMKKNIAQVPGIGVFNDDLRDGVKGHVFYREQGGFVSGEDFLESVKFGIAGSVSHPDVDYKKISYSDFPWAKHPSQTINYVSAHDNLTLYDKLKAVHMDSTEEELRDMARLSNAIILTSQGIPFLHGGVEMLRTKYGDDNSYRSPDSVNAINWSLKAKNHDVFLYYQGLINLRRKHPAFRMRNQEEIAKKLIFFGPEKAQPLRLQADTVIAYVLQDHAHEDAEGTIFVAFNGSAEIRYLDLPFGDWKVLVDKNHAGTGTLQRHKGGKVALEPKSTLIMASRKVILF